MFCPTSGSLRDPSSSVGSPNASGPGAFWAKSAGIGPCDADQCDELRHRPAEPVPLVRLLDVRHGRQRRLAVRQELHRRRLVRDQRAHLLGVLSHQRQRVHRAAAGGEEIHRAAAERVDKPVQVVGVLVRRRLAGVVRLLAAAGAARVVGDHRTVAEALDQAGEALGAHRRSDHQQDRLGGRRRLPYVVGQDGPRHVEGVGLRLTHLSLLRASSCWQGRPPGGPEIIGCG